MPSLTKKGIHPGPGHWIVPDQVLILTGKPPQGVGNQLPPLKALPFALLRPAVRKPREYMTKMKPTMIHPPTHTPPAHIHMGTALGAAHMLAYPPLPPPPIAHRTMQGSAQ